MPVRVVESSAPSQVPGIFSETLLFSVSHLTPMLELGFWLHNTNCWPAGLTSAIWLKFHLFFFPNCIILKFLFTWMEWQIYIEFRGFYFIFFYFFCCFYFGMAESIIVFEDSVAFDQINWPYHCFYFDLNIFGLFFFHCEGANSGQTSPSACTLLSVGQVYLHHSTPLLWFCIYGC